MRQILRFLVIAILAVNAGAAFGQVTTASINGVVKDETGSGLPGATVLAIHTPSGTQYGSVTQTNGSYSLPNLRIGGPYKVTISFIGYASQVTNGINLTLGQLYPLNVILKEQTSELQEVVITADNNPLLNDERSGAATNISNESISALPTLSRDISDFTRLTPQANGSSFAGQDNRFNNITIDGSIFNNSFGLSGTPAGQTNSTFISLDAVEEIQVNLAPYDVRQAGFTGAGINAVTRSGTNEIEGSIFYNTRSEGMVGRKAEDTEVVTDAFRVKQYGFRLGAPIIKDKLFIFVNGESERRDDPGTNFLASRPGLSGPNVTRVEASDLDQLSEFLIDNFNYNPGAYEGYQFETYSDKALIKFDYNVSKNHKVSLRYNYLKSFRDVGSSSSGSNGGRRGNEFSLNFQNSNYVVNNDIHSVVAEVNSNLLGGKASNKVIFGFTANRDYRSSNGGIFPLVDILEGGRNYTTFGYEPFTPNNELNTDTWQFSDNFTYYLGAHTLTAGVNFESFKFENTFTPRYFGYFRFNSLQDFYDNVNSNGVNGNPERYELTYLALPNNALPTATTKARQIGFYIQDEFQASERLKLTAGLRADIPFFEETALNNPIVDTLSFLDENGSALSLSTSTLPDAKILISPRIGFNFDVNGDRSTQLRGGTGVFTGKACFRLDFEPSGK